MEGIFCYYVGMKLFIKILMLVLLPAEVMASEYARNSDLFDYVAAENRDLGHHSDRDWTTLDKSLALAYQLVNAADWTQTRQIARRPSRYYEKDAGWLIGEHPTRRRVNMLFLTNALLQPLIANMLENPWRSLFQTYTVGSRIPTVLDNKGRDLDIVRW